MLSVYYYVFKHVLLMNKQQLSSKNKNVHEILDHQIDNLLILLDDHDRIL